MASGSTQSRGTAAMSVVMYVVAPIRRLDGTKASAIQRRYLPQLSGGSGGTPLHCSPPVAFAPPDGSPTSGSDRRRQSVSAHSTISTASARYPRLHRLVCVSQPAPLVRRLGSARVAEP